MIREGRVTVDGIQVTDPSWQTDPRFETLAVDGQPLRRMQAVYLKLNKPRGLITSTWERGRPTVYDVLPPLDAWVFPVGRLDAETTGLLLLTNDAEVSEALTNKDYGVEKRYELLARGEVTEEERRRLETGVTIFDGKSKHVETLPARCELLAREPRGTRLALTLTEGKNRQVRRMLEAVGHPVLELARTRVGPIELGDLPLGYSRFLLPEEVAALRRIAGSRSRPARPRSP